MRYSELSGRLVCGKRYCLRGGDGLSSSLVISLGRIKQSFVLTNPCLPDMPIVYASDAFLTLTGYKRQKVLGQNCRFLSGVDTDSPVLYEMKECILKGHSCKVQILNYSNRKDTSSFWNLLHISPVRTASGKTAYFVGVQVEAKCRYSESKELRPETRQLCVVGAVRVAVKSSFMVTCFIGKLVSHNLNIFTIYSRCTLYKVFIVIIKTWRRSFISFENKHCIKSFMSQRKLRK